jgi:hypothetical protein
VKKNTINLFIFLFVIILAYSCAQMAIPTGGEQDTTPPQPLKFSPENQSTNFKGREIAIEFDEYIKVQGLSSQLIVSPLLKNDVDFHIKKRTLYLTLNDTLKDRTTYIFNFGEAVKDLNEGNPNTKLKYVFSTGDYLDSTKIRGSIKDAYTLLPAKDVLVMLYDSYDDSIPLKDKPKYFVRTDASGRFELQFLKKDKYKLFALKDENSNYLYDLPNESIGFTDSLIISSGIDSLVPSFDLLLFQEDLAKVKVKKTNFRHPGKLTVIFSKPIEEDFSIKPIVNKFRIDWAKSEKLFVGDSIVYWVMPHSLSDTLSYEVLINDIPIDTIDPYLAGNPEKIPNMKISSSSKGSLDYFNDFCFELDYPAETIDEKRIRLFLDSIPLTDFNIVHHDSVGRKFCVQADWKEERQYRLIVSDSAFISYYESS